MAKVLLVALLLFLHLVHCEINVKHLAGPPSEFNDFSLPLPSQQAQVQHSASFKVHLHPKSSNSRELSQTVILPVDSNSEFQLAYFSPFSEVISLSLEDPLGAPVLLSGLSSFFPFGELQVPGTLYTFNNPVIGSYRLTLTTTVLNSSTFKKMRDNTEMDAYLILWNENPIAISSSLNTYSLTAGSQVGLLTHLFDSSASVSGAMKGIIETARLSVELPDGGLVNEPMYDDGLHADSEANDGIYGGLITATEAGLYTFMATFRGINEGVEFVRTTTHLVAVVEPTIQLSSIAMARLSTTGDRLEIHLVAHGMPHRKYRMYAEVWGVDREGQDIPVAWIGGMSFLQGGTIMLELDLNWISRAGANAPLTLKNVLVQDPSTFIPLAEKMFAISVKINFALQQAMANKTFLNKDGEITAEMREGKKPQLAPYSSAEPVPIVMVHGYCAEHNSFEIFNNGSDWTNPRFYLDPKKNLPHDSYAVNVSLWAANFGPYSYVGHSQGGAAGLHLKNFYFSGLDYVTDGRVVQSIGTPFQGSNGAGSAADLGKLFGMTCGYNFDMTLDGAALWLNSVTQQSREALYYYSTSYVKGQLFDNCNALTQLILRKPNDGVTEVDLAQLPQAQNQGNEERWCHIGGMKYPPQVQNSPRNQLMNSLSARTPLSRQF